MATLTSRLAAALPLSRRRGRRRGLRRRDHRGVHRPRRHRARDRPHRGAGGVRPRAGLPPRGSRLGPPGRAAHRPRRRPGARNLAAITPYYLPAGPQSLVDYYRRMAAVAGEARIFVYLYGARSTTTVTPAQLAELAEIPAVAGAKISGEPTPGSSSTSARPPTGSSCYSGNDVEFGDFVRAGGAGASPGSPASSRSRSSPSPTRCAAATSRPRRPRRTASNGRSRRWPAPTSP